MGTIKNAVYKVDNGTDFDEIHFKTKAEQVICSNGKTAEVQLADFMNFLNNGGTLMNTLNFTNISANEDKISTTKPWLSIGYDTTKGIIMESNTIRPYSSLANTISLGIGIVPFKDIAIGTPSIADVGYTKLPNGILLQWGTSSLLATNYTSDGLSYKTGTIYFPVAFPNKCFRVIASTNNRAWTVAPNGTPGLSSCSMEGGCIANTPHTTAITVHWIAVGY